MKHPWWHWFFMERKISVDFGFDIGCVVEANLCRRCGVLYVKRVKAFKNEDLS